MTEPQPEPFAPSRREFVAGLTALGVAWLSACTSDRERPPANAGDATMPGMVDESPAPAQKLIHFSAEDAAEIEAMTARIIPSDDGPGAREAGAVFFIDNQLAGLLRGQAPLFAGGLKDVAKAVAGKHGATARFSTLTAAQQDAVLAGLEKTEFFGALRFATIAGFLALPRYGGNKGYIGWQYIGQEHTFEHKPPFGYYDLPANQQALLGRVL
jgi:gluconate 2-dehydrogenase gamma chain